MTAWFGAVVVGLSACSSTASGGHSDDSHSFGSAGAPSSQGPDATAGNASVDGTACDPTLAVLPASCIDEQFAVFVASTSARPKGSDQNYGTRTSPLASLQVAIQQAFEHGKPLVIACESVTGDLDLDGATASLRVVGGYTCPGGGFGGWDPSSNRSSLLASDNVGSPSSDRALIEIHNSPGRITFENFSIKTTADNSKYGVHRIAAVFEKANVALENVYVEVERGATDTPPFTRYYSYPEDDALVGSTSVGDPGCSVTCAGGEKSAGGKGGLASGAPAQPGLPSLTGGKPGNPGDGGVFACDDYGTRGGDGADGAPGTPGTGAAGLASIQNGRFVATPGTSGLVGKVGQGGGGGGAVLDLNGVPGACGGCPGAAGLGGPAGGSSIAILSVDSKLSIDRSELVTGNGAPGAPGSEGQLGQAGGYTPYYQPDCAGGDGGKGGNGGSGGGGAGGLSVGVLYTVRAPMITATTIKVGLPGKGGVGLEKNSGIDGVAGDTFALEAKPHCAGIREECFTLFAQAACGAAVGCNWSLECTSSCFGAADEDACAVLSGCAWDDAGFCGDFGNNCDTLESESACQGGPGCVWGLCRGTTRVCDMLSNENCEGTPGCTLQ